MVTRDPTLEFDDPQERDYRADRGLGGGWFVWRRIGADGWVTLLECDSAGAAEAKAHQLNRENNDSPSAVHGTR